MQVMQKLFDRRRLRLSIVLLAANVAERFNGSAGQRGRWIDG